MSKIKSALELAMEKTADVNPDREAVRRQEGIKSGRVLAGRFLSDPSEVNLKTVLASAGREEGSWLKEGMLEALLANLTLPRYSSDLDRLPLLQKGFFAVINENKKVRFLLDEINTLFRQFLENVQTLETQLRSRWEDRLRQKEALLQQQTGRVQKLTADQDPEFVKLLSEEISHLETRYNEALKQGRNELRRLA